MTVAKKDALINKDVKTKSGKTLNFPFRILHGNSEYLDVKWRMVWFREDHPQGAIVTEKLEFSPNHAVFRATVAINGEVIATGHKVETKANFGDFLEKAETGAIGRALSAAGYGTQFASDLEEGERLADSPVVRAVSDFVPPSDWINDSPPPPSNEHPDDVSVERFTEHTVLTGSMICTCGNRMLRSKYPEHLPAEERGWYCPKCKAKKSA